MRLLRIKKNLPIVTALFLTLFLLIPAVSAKAATGEQIQHIYDQAGLLSTTELNNLEDMCITYSESDGLDIIILTHNDSSAVYAKQYIADFYDQMLYQNCIILLVDLAHRDVYIEDYGRSAMSHISSASIDNIVEEITPDLHTGDYASAFEQYILSTDKYMNSTPIFFNPLVHVAVAMIIGGIAVAVMAYNAGGRMTVGGNTYMDQNHSGLIGRRDDYIRTQITRVRKPQNNGGGGHGGGVSSGGHSFNGGGGKF